MTKHISINQNATQIKWPFVVSERNSQLSYSITLGKLQSTLFPSLYYLLVREVPICWHINIFGTGFLGDKIYPDIHTFAYLVCSPQHLSKFACSYLLLQDYFGLFYLLLPGKVFRVNQGSDLNHYDITALHNPSDLTM